MESADHLEAELRILRREFRTDLEADERSALMFVLFQELSERNLGWLLGAFFDEEQVIVQNEAVASLCQPPDERLLRSIRTRLETAGWDFEAA